MGLGWNTIQSGVTLFGGLFDKLMTNFDTLRSRFSGTAFPSNPVLGQPCWRSDRGTYGTEYTYTGNSALGESGWVETAQLATLGAELINARGSKPSVDARLDVALNEDGSLKAATTLNPSEWITLSGQTYAYVSTTQFTVTGDQRDIFTQYRRVKINRPGSTAFSEVVMSSYSSNTTVTILDTVLASDFTSIDHSIINTAGSGKGSVTAKSVGAIQSDIANDWSASQKLKGDALRLRLLDSGANGKEFSLVSDGGVISVEENTGTEGSPTWTTRASFAADWKTSDVPVRMTVLQALLDANGRNNAISAGTGLAVNLAATATPFVVTVPYGADAMARPIDYVHSDTTDISSAWSGLTNTTTNYLYYKRSSSGTWSRGFTTLAPAFGYGTAERPGSPSNGQLYYDISKAKWDLYTTSWAEQTDSYVFVGEAVTSGGSVASVVNYAIKGLYDSGSFAVTASSSYAKSVNMGAPYFVKVLFNEADIALTVHVNSTPQVVGWYLDSAPTANSITLKTGPQVAYMNGPQSSGNYRLIAQRRF